MASISSSTGLSGWPTSIRSSSGRPNQRGRKAGNPCKTGKLIVGHQGLVAGRARVTGTPDVQVRGAAPADVEKRPVAVHGHAVGVLQRVKVDGPAWCRKKFTGGAVCADLPHPGRRTQNVRPGARRCTAGPVSRRLQNAFAPTPCCAGTSPRLPWRKLRSWSRAGGTWWRGVV